ncbi:MAG: HAD family hydrolase [Bacteroidales bacterium]|nr:HAD family hydrolase [Bacteroidales bacterium]
MSTTNQPRVVIFDLDGTLYDKSGLACRLIFSSLVRGDLGLLRREQNARKKLRGISFNSEEQFYEAFFLEFPNPEKARRWYFERYMPLMVSILQRKYSLYSWVSEILKQLKDRQIRVAVFSDYGCVEDKLQAIGFDPRWADALFDAPALGGLKPCKESFAKLCEALNVKPEECLMVGDRHDTDGLGAESVGMSFSLYVRNCRPGINLDASHL